MSIVILTSFLAISSCGLLREDPLVSYLTEREQEISSFPMTAPVVFSEIYGSDWREYSFICPYMSYRDVEDALSVEDPPIPKYGLSEGLNSLFLRSYNGEERWIRFSREEINLCPVSFPGLVLNTISNPVEFKLENRGGVWVLSGVD